MNKVYLTVDTECHDRKKENIYIWGEKKEKNYGIRRILEYGKEYNIPINFFVDFAEAADYGKDFIHRVVSVIQAYNQPVYLHLHPNHISGDSKRTYLWEYSVDEKKELLKKGIEYYINEIGERPMAFRAGRYGVDRETYDLLDEMLPGCIELSYKGGYGKMCHVSYDTVNTINHSIYYKSLLIVPNCAFVALKVFNKHMKVGVDTSEMSLTEFREFLQEAHGRDFVLTMHSWNFINRLFWSKKYVGENRKNERLFSGMIKLLNEFGYEFADIKEAKSLFDETTDDIIYDATNGLFHRVRSIFLNYWRFQHMAKLSKKYFRVFSSWYIFLAIVATALLMRFLS